jgi:hypothetical protein
MSDDFQWHDDEDLTPEQMCEVITRAYAVIGRHMARDLDGIKQLVGDDPIPMLAAMTTIAVDALSQLYGGDPDVLQLTLGQHLIKLRGLAW